MQWSCGRKWLEKDMNQNTVVYTLFYSALIYGLCLEGVFIPKQPRQGFHAVELTEIED